MEGITDISILQERVIVEPGSEKRATLKLITYWEVLRQRSSFPALRQIHPGDFDDIWPDCFLMEVIFKHGVANFEVSYRGARVRDMFWGYLSKDALDRMLNRQLDMAGQIVKEPEPIIDEDVIKAIDGKEIRYRQALVPLGEAGQVDHILGVIRYSVI